MLAETHYEYFAALRAFLDLTEGCAHCLLGLTQPAFLLKVKLPASGLASYLELEMTIEISIDLLDQAPMCA